MQADYLPPLAFGTSQLDHAEFNFNFGEMYAQPGFAGQQTTGADLGHSFGTELYNDFTTSMLQPPFNPGPSYPVRGYFAPQGPPPTFGQPFAFGPGMNLPAGGYFPQGGMYDQAPLPASGYLPESPMIATAQPFFAPQPLAAPQAIAAPQPVDIPQAFFAPQPAITPQPAFTPQPFAAPHAIATPQPAATPQPVAAPQPAITQPAIVPQPAVSPQPVAAPQPTTAPQVVPVTQPITAPQPPQAIHMAQTAVDDQVIQSTAMEARRLLMVLRLNQIYNPDLHVPKGKSKKKLLLPFEKLGLQSGMAEEYQVIAQGDIPLFVTQSKDWDNVFGFLSEHAFHTFWREEVQNAQRLSQSLPPLDPTLTSYIQQYPPHQAVLNRIDELLDFA